MLDIKLIRENPGEISQKIKDKGADIDLDQVLKIDEEIRELGLSVQKLREERNKVSKEKDIEKGKEIKKELYGKEESLKKLETDLREQLLQIPNAALPEVPVGDESKNEVIKKVGEPKKFNFTPKDHLELGENLGIIDTERAAKVSGSRFAYLKGDGALLEFALIQFVLEKLGKVGFIPIVSPVLIKKDITEELGYWHGKKEGTTNNEEYYWLNDPKENQEMYLVGTAEHAVVPMHKDEVFSVKDLPKRYIAFSSAFRREAGSYGKDTKGIIRVHQFDKLEMVSFVKPEDDKSEREKLLSIAEELVSELGLSYQIVRLASRDISFPSAETIDIETWMPSQDKYRETHSISTTTDFQARRLNIKYLPAGRQGQDGAEKKFVHILNGTAFAIGRTIVAILENYQEEDGSVLVPEVLQKYIGKNVISPD
ncbi:MAG: serine--tRNA ligase [Patescibacteria group bacterium]